MIDLVEIRVSLAECDPFETDVDCGFCDVLEVSRLRDVELLATLRAWPGATVDWRQLTADALRTCGIDVDEPDEEFGLDPWGFDDTETLIRHMEWEAVPV